MDLSAACYLEFALLQGASESYLDQLDSGVGWVNGSIVNPTHAWGCMQGNRMKEVADIS